MSRNSIISKTKPKSTKPNKKGGRKPTNSVPRVVQQIIITIGAVLALLNSGTFKSWTGHPRISEHQSQDQPK
jgi:hypothetical protein